MRLGFVAFSPQHPPTENTLVVIGVGEGTGSGGGGSGAEVGVADAAGGAGGSGARRGAVTSKWAGFTLSTLTTTTLPLTSKRLPLAVDFLLQAGSYMGRRRVSEEPQWGINDGMSQERSEYTGVLDILAAISARRVATTALRRSVITVPLVKGLVKGYCLLKLPREKALFMNYSMRLVEWRPLVETDARDSSSEKTEGAAQYVLVEGGPTLTNYHEFAALPFETMGPWSEDTKKIIKDLSTRLVLASGDPRAGTYLSQRLGITVQRANCPIDVQISWNSGGFSLTMDLSFMALIMYGLSMEEAT
ncbi:hypothetical protein MSG28_015462 [Choristoneura fumiferana]|uniref:Uncharacterized protein n=1 Tax=Choristoneura fumiferana TaxID=7141 RepID=A0ACC0KAD4_CHOFU|nr:hypothetical protein MSG28_015462 [Choristoneura fumiferana]